MLFTLANSILIVIDMQGNLAAAMHDREALYANVARLIQAAELLGMPLILTEQVPDKIGDTIAEVRGVLPAACAPVIKESFSCWGCQAFRDQLEAAGRREVILCGIETHVCVSQTALDLLASDYHVGCVADATSARAADNKHYALNRLQTAGAQIVTTEMLVTELLKTSAHPRFKEILKLIK